MLYFFSCVDMMNFCHFNLSPHPNRMLSRSLLSAIAAVSLLSGLTLNFSSSHPLVVGTTAYAQNVSDPQVTSYAQAVLRMEPVRQQAYDEIKNIIGSSNVPPIVCNKPESLDALPGNARNIATDYCDRSKEIVEKNGLTISRFNEITVNMQSDTNLKDRIQAELLRIQGSK